MSNPPYIRTEEISRLDEEVKLHDPWIALDGKEDGLYFYRLIVKDSIRYLNKGGYILFEIGFDQGKDVSELLKNKGYEVIYLLDDVDEFVMQTLQTFREKTFKNATQGDLDLDSEDEKKELEQTAQDNKELLDFMKESLKNNIGLKFAFRSTDTNEIKQTLEFFGLDSEDENNQKRLRDLENGQCLMQDLYGRVGVVQIHPVFVELLHAFDTRPPIKSEVDLE